MDRREGNLPPITWPRILIYVVLAAAVVILFPDASFAALIAVFAVAVLIELAIWHLGQRR